jgi:hypothetical protein
MQAAAVTSDSEKFSDFDVDSPAPKGHVRLTTGCGPPAAKEFSFWETIMTSITISIFNDSTALTDAQVADAVPALQIQVSDHFAPAWGVDATLNFVPKGQTPPAGTWWLTVLDNSDQAGALGYHDTTPDGLPIGKIFAQTDLDNHLSWTVTASHELLEMLGDPDVNLTTFIQDTATSGRLYSYEVCDAVEDDQYGYVINGITVSDFVLPAYFEPATAGHTPGTQYDYCNKLTGPVPKLLSGGYIGEFDVKTGGGWNQITAATEGQPHRGHLRSNLPSSRANRRRTPRTGWVPSKPRDPRLVPMDTKPERLVPMGPEPRLVPMATHPEPRLVPMGPGGGH